MDSTLNIDALLSPISQDSPSGDDLRYTPVFDRIREARRADDVLEQGEWKTEVKTSDWRQVIKLCREVLTVKSKDLQVAVWLTEAMMHQNGFAGLAAGLELIQRLIQDFWPTLHPPAEEGDLDYRIGPLTMMNEKLSGSLYEIPLCDPLHTRGYNHHQWEESRMVGFNQNLDKEQKRRRDALIGEGKISGEDFAAAVNSGSIGFYRNLAAQLDRCHIALQSLDNTLSEKFAPDPPGLMQLIEAVEACAHLAGRILKEKSQNEIVPQEQIESDKTAAVLKIPSKILPDEPGQGQRVEVMMTQRCAISDISDHERWLWQQVSGELEQGRFKDAMDQLLSAAALAPSVREKNRYLLLVAKLCLKAERADLASPIVEELYKLIETLNLEKWEHPAWVAEVVETLYQCLRGTGAAEAERAKILFQKLCMLNVTKAAAYRIDA